LFSYNLNHHSPLLKLPPPGMLIKRGCTSFN
jgi:hypothetical protein